MPDAVEHDGKVRVCGRNITKLLLADDRDALAREEQELEALKSVLDPEKSMASRGRLR